MNEKAFIKKVIKLFANKTGCNIQANGCPCNTCFHSIDANFNHIAWLIILGIRGDYNEMHNKLLADIKKELEEQNENSKRS